MPDFIVYPNKTKMVFLSLGALLFVIAGVGFLAISLGTEDALFIGIIGTISILFFGFCAIYAVKEIFSKKPALIINSEGITDRSSYLGAGLVEWKDIADIKFVPFSGQVFLAIYTHDANLIIERSSSMQGFLNKLNRSLLDSQVNIVYKNLKCTEEELINQIEIHWKSYAEVIDVDQ